MSGRNYSSSFAPDLSLVAEASQEEESEAELETEQPETEQPETEQQEDDFDLDSSSDEDEENDGEDNDGEDNTQEAEVSSSTQQADPIREITRQFTKATLSSKPSIIILPKRSPQLAKMAAANERQPSISSVESSIIPVPRRPPLVDKPSTETSVEVSNSKTNSKNKKVSDPEPEKSVKSGKVTKSKRKKDRNMDSFATYIRKVLKKNEENWFLTISSETMNILDSFIHDMFERICLESWKMVNTTRMAKMNKSGVTLSEAEIESSVRLVIPGELGRYAIINGRRALKQYKESLEADAKMMAKTDLERHKKLWMPVSERANSTEE